MENNPLYMVMIQLLDVHNDKVMIDFTYISYLLNTDVQGIVGSTW